MAGNKTAWVDVGWEATGKWWIVVTEHAMVEPERTDVAATGWACKLEDIVCCSSATRGFGADPQVGAVLSSFRRLCWNLLSTSRVPAHYARRTDAIVPFFPLPLGTNTADSR